MRRRTVLPTATTALLAAALLLPATGAEAATSTATGAASATSAPTADPTTQITGLWALQTDHGYVLRATATGDVDHVTFVLQQHLPAGGDGPGIDITGSAPSADGSWQTTGPLGVPHAYYDVSAYAYAADGTPSLESGGWNPVPITLLPVFHDTVFSTAPLSFDNPVETVSGRLTTYDPDSGDTGTPWSGPMTIQASAGNTNTPTTPNRATTQAIAADGSWSIAFRPDPNTGTTMAVSVAALLPFQVCAGCAPESINGPSTTVATVLNTPTRIILDHTSATLTAGTKTTVTGVLQYQNASGWHPVPSGWVYLGGDGTWSPHQTQTDANGRFSFPLTVPATTRTMITAWPIYTSASSVSLYLAAAQSGFDLTDVPQQPALLTFQHIVHGTTGTPGRVVHPLHTTHGHTDWTDITTLRATTTWNTRSQLADSRVVFG